MKTKIILFAILNLLLLSSCNKEDEIPLKSIDLEDNLVSERVFKFEKCLELTDGDYKITYCIQSDTESEMNNIIELKPRILVTPYNANDLGNLENLNETQFVSDENIVETHYDIVEVIKESNIPDGYMLEIKYDKSKLDDLSNSRRGSYANRYFTNSGAKGIYVVRSPSHTVPCYFYTNEWWGWKDRGFRTLGPSNTYSHTFYTTTYTTRPGARMRAYTTIPAWNGLYKKFLY